MIINILPRSIKCNSNTIFHINKFHFVRVKLYTHMRIMDTKNVVFRI